MKKVFLINGSPHENGCTFTGLSEVANTLQKFNIETEIFHIGIKPVRGCISCGKCAELGKCAFDDDICNEMTARMRQADGIVVGSPVYYAGPNGTLCALLDRAFYSSAASGAFTRKPAAAIVNCRRGGASASFDRLNKYFSISQMFIVTSQYWNSIHGFTPEDVKEDLEGLQTMRTLGKNMAYLIESLSKANLPAPEIEEKIMTNFIS